MRSTRLFLLFCLFVVPAAVYAQPASDSPRYTFGIVPQQSSTKLVRAWAPILKHLGDKTGYRLDFQTAKDIPTFEQRLAQGEYDFAYMSPYTYTVLHRGRAGYEAFAKQKDEKLVGIIVVRTNSTYTSLSDLRDATLAFPAPAAIAATVIPQAYLKQRGIAFIPRYVSSHDSVYLSIAKGLYPAGGGVTRTFEALPAAVRKQLRILWTTPSYTPHPFAVHRRVPREVVERLRAAMIAMDHDPEGKALLARIAFSGITGARDAEYDDLRALGLTISDHLLRKPK